METHYLRMLFDQDTGDYELLIYRIGGEASDELLPGDTPTRQKRPGWRSLIADRLRCDRPDPRVQVTSERPGHRI